MSDLLTQSYEECKRLNALHGKTYYLATLLLPAAKRPPVHALYGFARYADEIVDDLASTLTPEEKAVALRTWGDTVLADLRAGESNDLIGRALVDTVKKYSIPLEYFDAFMVSMEMDLTVTRYKTYDDLMTYVYGSAVVIGLEMLPILGYSDPRAIEAATALGTAFQLANFIRDIGEDIDRGRIYMPLDDLARFGVSEEMLLKRELTPEIVEAIKYQIARVRDLQAKAEAGIQYLDPISRPCIRAASELYCGIVDEIEANGYDIFNKRATTSTWRRTRVAGIAFIQTLFLRMR
ncbi:MAG: phytoene/squalene synthase family protein [Candidatus Planktophila sp.]|jgi:phytoene synthase|nr:phytoene/squalene synthase family protein [Candidatus Planktophila sp.]MBP7903034.1 phytoene/squalene synthase family protein [Candidatus Planktophila sp.]